MLCLTCCEEEGFHSLPEPDKKPESECRTLSGLIHPFNHSFPFLIYKGEGLQSRKLQLFFQYKPIFSQ